MALYLAFGKVGVSVCRATIQGRGDLRTEVTGQAKRPRAGGLNLDGVYHRWDQDNTEKQEINLYRAGKRGISAGSEC